ncbi:sensor histidine kinase [Lacinutrix chionoecetis]
MLSKKLKKTNFNEHANFEILLTERANKRVAGELHDNLSSKLSILRFKLCDKPNNTDFELLSLLDNIIGSVRKISHGLYSPAIEHCSFLDAVRDFVTPLHNSINIEVQCVNEKPKPLNTITKLNLFRIFQELINNILKHANASCILIRIRFTEQSVSLSVKDNGIGFSKTLGKQQGIGLTNIVYRAEALKAKYKFFTKKNLGTLFIIVVPLNTI